MRWRTRTRRGMGCTTTSNGRQVSRINIQLEVTQPVYIIGGRFGWARRPMLGPCALVLNGVSRPTLCKGFLAVT